MWWVLWPLWSALQVLALLQIRKAINSFIWRSETAWLYLIPLKNETRILFKQFLIRVKEIETVMHFIKKYFPIWEQDGGDLLYPLKAKKCWRKWKKQELDELVVSLKGIWKSTFSPIPHLVWETLESADTIRLDVEDQSRKELREAKKQNYLPVKESLQGSSWREEAIRCCLAKGKGKMTCQSGHFESLARFHVIVYLCCCL